MRHLLFSFLSLFLIVGLAGAHPAPQTGPAGSEVASPSPPKKIVIKPVGNQMKYATTEFTVTPGQKVRLVFKNTATSPSMKHNVVVLTRPPKQKFFKKVGQAGMRAGAGNDYVPTDMDVILAHTPISDPGETVSVTFTVPEKTGDYGYVCTFPGHWATMQGTMHVEN